jgi:hypothetical protein
MRVRVFFVALLAAALPGCWILDELDEGGKKVEMFTSKGMQVEEGEPEAAPASSGKRQRIGEYFANQKNVRTLTPGQVSADIVSCKLDGGTQFMKQAECLARGGVPKN